jgi:hypothetical protein
MTRSASSVLSERVSHSGFMALSDCEARSYTQWCSHLAWLAAHAWCPQRIWLACQQCCYPSLGLALDGWYSPGRWAHSENAVLSKTSARSSRMALSVWLAEVPTVGSLCCVGALCRGGSLWYCGALGRRWLASSCWYSPGGWLVVVLGTLPVTVRCQGVVLFSSRARSTCMALFWNRALFALLQWHSRCQ